MTDRRLLRRYLALVQHADELFDERSAVDPAPVPAEAVAVLDELTLALAPLVAQFPARAPEPDEVRRQLAGWVH